MPEIKYDRNHHAGADADARIRNRLRNSGDTANADSVTQTGNSQNRTITNVHLSGSAKRHGSVHEGEPAIDGSKRTAVNTGDGR